MKTRIMIRQVLVMIMTIICIDSHAQLLVKRSFDKTTKELTVTMQNESDFNIKIVQPYILELRQSTCLWILFTKASYGGRDSFSRSDPFPPKSNPFQFFKGKSLCLKPDSIYVKSYDLKKFEDQKDLIELQTEGNIIYEIYDKNTNQVVGAKKLDLEREYYDFH